LGSAAKAALALALGGVPGGGEHGIGFQLMLETSPCFVAVIRAVAKNAARVPNGPRVHNRVSDFLAHGDTIEKVRAGDVRGPGLAVPEARARKTGRLKSVTIRKTSLWQRPSLLFAGSQPRSGRRPLPFHNERQIGLKENIARPRIEDWNPCYYGLTCRAIWSIRTSASKYRRFTTASGQALV
jgi:hypothetical protein